jgi:hypothetical protein
VIVRGRCVGMVVELAGAPACGRAELQGVVVVLATGRVGLVLGKLLSFSITIFLSMLTKN